MSVDNNSSLRDSCLTFSDCVLMLLVEEERKHRQSVPEEAEPELTSWTGEAGKVVMFPSQFRNHNR